MNVEISGVCHDATPRWSFTGWTQTSVMGMAGTGKSYREILRHYYSGTVLRKLW